MSKTLGVVMDPITSIKPAKDTSFAMMLAAQARDWRVYTINPSDLHLRNEHCFLKAARVSLQDDPDNYFQADNPEALDATCFDVMLMRVDPPFNMNYIYATYFLEQAQKQGVMVVNDPRALRDANEKVFTIRFPQCCADSLIGASIEKLRDFVAEIGDTIVKPLDVMGGSGVYRTHPDDQNLDVILETLTNHGQRPVIAQRYLPAIEEGDKRIFLLDGEPVPYALLRTPPKGQLRANLVTGGTATHIELSNRDRWICEQLGPELRARGLRFVGIDVIGDYLTEINVTSPTGVRELDRLCSLDIGGKFIESLTGNGAQG